MEEPRECLWLGLASVGLCVWVLIWLAWDRVPWNSPQIISNRKARRKRLKPVSFRIRRLEAWMILYDDGQTRARLRLHLRLLRHLHLHLHLDSVRRARLRTSSASERQPIRGTIDDIISSINASERLQATTVGCCWLPNSSSSSSYPSKGLFNEQHWTTSNIPSLAHRQLLTSDASYYCVRLDIQVYNSYIQLAADCISSHLTLFDKLCSVCLCCVNFSKTLRASELANGHGKLALMKRANQVVGQKSYVCSVSSASKPRDCGSLMAQLVVSSRYIDTQLHTQRATNQFGLQFPKLTLLNSSSRHIEWVANIITGIKMFEAQLLSKSHVKSFQTNSIRFLQNFSPLHKIPLIILGLGLCIRQPEEAISTTAAIDAVMVWLI